VAAAASTVHGRVLVVDDHGRLVSDSSGSPRGTAYGGRPEIGAALRRGTPQEVRHSQSLGLDLLATARPIVHDGAVVGAVRITQSLADVGAAKSRTQRQLFAVGAVVLLIGLLAGSLIASATARPLRRLERAARRVAGGDFAARAVEQGSTEQRSLARSFNEMTERLGGVLGAQQRFVADASHQLRTPLTGLRLRLEAAASPGRRQDARTADLRAATAEVDRLTQLIDGLLVLSRTGEGHAAAESCDLVDAAEDAVDRFASAAMRAGIALRVVPGSGAVRGLCSPGDIGRALDALIENAVAYGAGGGIVEVAVLPGRVEVRDRGPGLAPGEQEEVFDRFHRGSASPGVPGTGLGLAIVRALARSWGGDARLEHRSGGGAVAVLDVPEPSGRVKPPPKIAEPA
jgi:signal transduction histidine kinase